jgi:starvation-inducible DNA-binding protein
MLIKRTGFAPERRPAPAGGGHAERRPDIAPHETSIGLIVESCWPAGTVRRQSTLVAARRQEDAMHSTRIDLTVKTRAKVAVLLNARLADAIDLRLQTKQAHWNVKGPQFIALHELFDRLAGELEGFVDEMAERVTALGGIAEGTVQAVVGRTRLDAYPLDIGEGRAHLDALAAAYARYGKLVRKAIGESGRAGDADTSDLFTGVSRGVDKALWLLEAHLQADR